MKSTAKKFRGPLAAFISLFLVFCPAYLQYNDLIEIDFLSPGPSFENSDSENLTADQHYKFNLGLPVFSPDTIFADCSPLGEPLQLGFPILSLVQPIFVLRC